MTSGEGVYPIWKKVLWRFGRVFIAAFVTVLGGGLMTLQTLDVAVLRAIITAAIIGGINALGKALREEYGEPTRDGEIDKLFF